MTLFENEVGMEPGDVLLRQLKAKFPPKKKVSSKGKEKKVKKMKKKVKKVKMQVPDEDLGKRQHPRTFCLTNQFIFSLSVCISGFGRQQRKSLE